MSLRITWWCLFVLESILEFVVQFVLKCVMLNKIFKKRVMVYGNLRQAHLLDGVRPFDQ